MDPLWADIALAAAGFVVGYAVGWGGNGTTNRVVRRTKERALRRHTHQWRPSSKEWTNGQQVEVRVCDDGHPRMVDRRVVE